MDYPFESLNPDSFQELAQALLVKEFPGLQCFPVGQADGGRDAGFSSTTDKIIFQVKFSRSPATIKDPFKWLTDTIKGEKDSIERLIASGASRYILITNVRGTAKWESGSIDKISKYLEENIEVPAQCFWRDEVNRRIESSPSIRWSYPQLLSGLDAIQVLLDQNNEEGKRRSRALSVYLGKQFEKENSVRFKQVDLQNDILSLFIDVPIYTGADSEFSKESYNRQNRIINTLIKKLPENELPDSASFEESEREYYSFEFDGKSRIGAATFFLNNMIQEEVPFVVLEGGPGQGKSTLTQYICQVHRAKLLNKRNFLEKINKTHNQQSARIPFRIDLRDLAVWLEGRNPFLIEKHSSKAIIEKRSVENFLAHHISFETGGIDFSVNDFFSIIAKSHLLVIFDGLDEVPDFERRNLVVAEIQNSISRMKVETLSLQSIVTSRPAALSNAPGLPKDSFPVFVLDAVTPDLAKEYARNWAGAKKLPQQDTRDLLSTLSEKLQQPHLVDLARNPMQLTILLTLILSRGSSLPDKRTALYDQYVDLFFTREAEKSTTVRDQRDLIISIHRYIAWHLHTRAETGGEGRIGENDLIDVLKTYLQSQGYDTQLAELLFSGIVERVVFLVSRIQGTFEFEVQPLREYFVGRYLYETAAYSPTGMESKGTLPDRFDGISRNFYWFNVVRFFSGCYSVGELPSLIDCIDNLMDDPDYRNLGYTRALCVSLLSDWVFSQHPRSIKKVIDLISKDNGIKLLIASSRLGNNPFYDELRIPEKCGRKELIEFCDHELRKNNSFDYEQGLADIIRVNKSRSDLSDYWFNFICNTDSTSTDRIFNLCRSSGGLETFTNDQLTKIEKSISNRSSFYEGLAESGQFSFITSNESRLSTLINNFLSSSVNIRFIPRATHLVECFLGYYNAAVLSFIKEDDEPDPETEDYNATSIKKYLIDNFAFEKLTKESVPEHGSETLTKINRCLKTLNIAINGPSEKWSKSIDNFSSLIESLRSEFGPVWKSYEISLAVLGLNLEDFKHNDFSDIFDESCPLAYRVYSSKHHVKNPGWLEQSIKKSKTSEHRSFISLIAISALKTTGTAHLIPEIDRLILNLNSWSLTTVLASIHLLSLQSELNINVDKKRDSIIEDENQFSLLSTRTKIVLSPYLSTDQKKTIVSEISGGFVPVAEQEKQTINKILFGLLREELKEDEELQILKLIKEYYLDGARVDPIILHGFLGSSKIPSIISENARNTILAEPRSFPIEIVSLAETNMRKSTAEKIKTVEEISSTEEWFHQSI